MNGGAGLGREDGLWLASLLLLGCLTLAIFALNAHRFTGHEGGVPLDDAWIHFQFARNLARGDGLSFNPGQPTAGSTAPLWTLLLAAIYFVSGRFPIAGQALSAACYLATLAATYALGKRLTGSRWAGWLASAVVAANGRMVWAGLSALETCLFATLGLLAIGSHLQDRARGQYRLRTAALFGLAALSRPEGYLLFALATIDYVFVPSHTTLHTPRFTRRLLHLLPSLVLFTIIILPYLVFSLRTSGRPLPNTYHAKATFDFLPDRDFLSLAARYLILDNPLLLPFYVLGVGLLFRRASLLSLWSLGLPLAYAFLHATLYQHGRYLMPLIPCNAVVAVWGLREAEKLACRRWPPPPAPAGPPRMRGGQRTVVVLVSLLVVAGTAWRLPAMAGQYARNVEEINEMHVALGHWVRENAAPDAVLAVNDIGAITYISERPVVDLAGLVTPEVTPTLRSPGQTEQLIAFLAQRDVAYVLIFPNWFPSLAARDDVLEEVHRISLENRTIAGGETMVVYRTRWRR